MRLCTLQGPLRHYGECPAAHGGDGGARTSRCRLPTKLAPEHTTDGNVDRPGSGYLGRQGTSFAPSLAAPERPLRRSAPSATMTGDHVDSRRSGAVSARRQAHGSTQAG